MSRSEHSVLIGSVVVVLIAAAGVTAILRFSQRDVDFCHAVLADLAAGRPWINRHLDWERLTVMGVNVGDTYSHLSNTKEKADYQRAFIQQFARGFEQAGGDIHAFINWRLAAGNGSEDRVVIADYPAKQKTILFRLSESGKRRVTAIEWQS